MSTTPWFSRFLSSFLPARRIAKLITLSAIASVLAYSQVRTNVVTGYYQAGGALPLSKLSSNYVWSHMDYLVYAFAGVNTSDNSCGLTYTADLAALKQIRASNSNLRLIISIGGQNVAPAAFQTVAAASNIVGFVTSCVDTFISGKAANATNIFDGIDVDWEFPTKAYQGEFNALLQQFRTQLGTSGILTAAILPTQCDTCNSDINFGTATVFGATHWVDFFNVMAYNYAGPWSGADPSNAPIGHIMEDIDNLIPRVPADKIVLGIPFYGSNYAGYPATTSVTSYSNVASLIAESKPITLDSDGNPATMSYAAIKAKNLSTYYDSTKPVEGSGSTVGSDYESAWAYDATNRVLWNYDDQNTIAAKASWALTRTNLYDASLNNSNVAEPLAGIMSWDLSQDNNTNTLLCAMEKAMAPGGTPVCVVPPTTTVLYDFESGVANWTHDTGIGSLTTSAAEHITGTHSLTAVSAASVKQGLIYVAQSGLAKGGTVRFNVWVPATSHLTSVQPFICNSSYQWTTSSTTTFNAGGWTTFAVTVPANAIEIGVSFDSNSGFAGNVYIDSITYTTP